MLYLLYVACCMCVSLMLITIDFFYNSLLASTAMEEVTLGTNSLASMNKFREAMHEAIAKPVWQSERQAASNRWNPYSFEGGCVL